MSKFLTPIVFSGLATLGCTTTLPPAAQAAEVASRQARMEQKIDTSGSDQAVAQWIWRNLVPKNGQADTVQGELLRAVEKLRWEAQENGNINWDDGFAMLVNYLRSTLASDPALAGPDRRVLNSDLDRLLHFTRVEGLRDPKGEAHLPYVKDDLYDRLTGFVVAFARAHPALLERAANPALHR